MKNLILSVAILTSVFNFAQQREDIRLRGERKRVVQGVKSGEVTTKETVAIEKQARDIKQAKRAAATDGQVTALERAKIARQDRQLDRTIYRKKHN